jgi:hypothetical protein
LISHFTIPTPISHPLHLFSFSSHTESVSKFEGKAQEVGGTVRRESEKFSLSLALASFPARDFEREKINKKEKQELPTTATTTTAAICR